MTAPKRPPRDNLYRAVIPGLEYRAESEDNRPRLEGHFARFGEWNRIDSFFEGTFLERIDPGAFKRTLKNKGTQMPVLFQHGQDPEIGDKVIAATEELREDETGPFFRARVLEGLPELVMSGLRENRYGVSYRFRVLKEDFQGKPGKSKHNPEGIPERTIQEAEVFEYGPVTFPADPGASVAVRSLTDAYLGPDLIRNLLSDPERARHLIEVRPELVRNDPALASAIQDALPDDGPDASHSEPETRAEEPESPLKDVRHYGRQVAEAIAEGVRSAPPVEPPPTVAEPTPQDPPTGGSLSVREDNKVKTIEERRARVEEIDARRSEIHNEYGVAVLPQDVQAEWDQLEEERGEHQKAIEAYETRSAALQAAADKPKNVERAVPNVIVRGGTQSHVPSNIYALEEYRGLSSNDEQMKDAMRDGAMRSIESAVFAHPQAEESRSKSHIERLLSQDKTGRFSAHLLATGNPVYQRAFGKILAGRMLTAEETRAVATVGSTQLADGGYAIPYTLDPTIILTSSGQVNPLRAISRVETLTGAGNTWKGVTSAGISVSRQAEEAAITATSPTLAQPEVTAQSVKGEIDFSIESDQDWPRLQSEMARLLQDAKDAEEVESFTNGVGTTVNPEGIVAGLASTSDVGTTGDGFDLDDLDRLVNALPDRFEPNARFMGHRAVFTKIESLQRALGGGDVYRAMAAGQPPTLLGYPRHNNSAMESDFTTTGNDILVFGDFSNFLIVDKAGMSIEIDPHVRNGDGKWTGQRALLAHWRNSSLILVDNAFRVLKVGVVTS